MTLKGPFKIKLKRNILLRKFQVFKAQQRKLRLYITGGSRKQSPDQDIYILFLVG